MIFDHHHSPERLTAHVTLRTTRRARQEGGFIMVMFALLLVPLLLMVGFSVDVGSWYNRAQEMQRAADAAALAGVVWLPDETAAETAALASAAKNGFVPGGSISVNVERSTQSDRRLKVTITDTQVGSFFYESITGQKIDLSRTAYAEYVLAVPMGSPRNFIGTGTLLNTYTTPGIPAEFLYQSVNPYCTDKVNGDRYQSANSGGTCSGSANSEYRTSGYTTVIEVPEGRTSPIEVRLWDARYNEDAISWQVQNGTSCTDVPAYSPADPNWTTSTSSTNVTIVGPAEYQTRSSTTGAWSGTLTLVAAQTYTRAANLIRYRVAPMTWSPAAPSWTGPTTSTTNLTINGPKVYQTRTSSTAAWSADQYVAQGSSVTFRRDRLRYRNGTVVTVPNCQPVYQTVTDPAIDDYRQDGTEEYTYTLYSADNTPLNDTDNPVMCQATFTQNSPFSTLEYLGSRRWNSLCTIPTNTLPGRYLLRVHNGGQYTDPEGDGSNQYGVVARYTDAAADGLCDGRTDTMCPRVYADDALSVRAAANTTVASFFLAEIAPEHDGKRLRLELFDPGEGGSSIEILRPTGSDGNTWTPASFSWTGNAATGATSGTNVTSVSVADSRFNGRLIQITIDLGGYNPPANNQWWKIRYNFAGTVTDRTTWSARVIGDPVHLVEEV